MDKKSIDMQFCMNDYKKAEEFCEQQPQNSIISKKNFDSMFVDYAEYIASVVENVSFSLDFIGDSSLDSRNTMEELNAKRTQAHNKAITSTLKINNELIKNGIIYDMNLLGKDSLEELTPEQRRNFGNFIFKMSAARSLTISEKIRKNPDKNKIEMLDSGIIKETSRNYNIKVTDSQDDVYKQLSKRKDAKCRSI